MKTQKFGITLHLAVLAIAILLSPPDLSRLGSLDGFVQFLLSIAFLLAMFYTCFLWLVPAYLAEKQTALFVLMVFIAANLMTFIGYSLLQLAHLGITGSGVGFMYSPGMHFSGFHAMIMAALFGSLFRVVYAWFGLLPSKKN
jgi:hypothetical protein